MKNAIPTLWTNCKNNTVTTNHIVFEYNNTAIPLKNCTTKTFRAAITCRTQTKPICEAFWNGKFKNLELNWNDIWKNNIKKVKEPRLMTINWKIISNVYPTKIFLHKIGKEMNNICDKCNVIDYIEHFFYTCKKVNQIWDEVNNILFQKYNDTINISVTDVLFGFKHKDELRCIQINKIMGVGKMCISKFRYGKHPNISSLLHSELQIRNLYDVNNNT